MSEFCPRNKPLIGLSFDGRLSDVWKIRAWMSVKYPSKTERPTDIRPVRLITKSVLC